MISLIVAVAENGVIGNNGALPWPHLKQDMDWFRKHTTGHAVVMGRKTWDSLPSKPLPSRVNMIVSNNPKLAVEYHSADVIRLGKSWTNWIQIYQQSTDKDAFIIGGAEIYRQTLPHVDKIYLTNVYGEYEGDTYFTELALALGDFHLEYKERVPNKCDFEIWKRYDGYNSD